MPTIRKRGAKWQAQVRLGGCNPQSKSFTYKSDAVRWAQESERALENGTHPSQNAKLDEMLAQLLARYLEVETPTKKGADIEAVRLRRLMVHPVLKLSIGKLEPSIFAAYRDSRLKEVSGDTVLRELSLLQSVIEVAIRDWGYPIAANPVRGVRKPKPGKARTRRLQPGEEAELLSAAEQARNKLLKPMIQFALETAMRRGEILSLKWEYLTPGRDLALIPETKNGHPRTIPLTDKAKRVIEKLNGQAEYLFPMTPNAFRLAWGRMMRRCEIDDLRFHDLRHEAVSRFFERGLSIPEVALISGHRDPRMLFRYTHLKPEDVAAKLKAVS